MQTSPVIADSIDYRAEMSTAVIQEKLKTAM